MRLAENGHSGPDGSSWNILAECAVDLLLREAVIISENRGRTLGIFGVPAALKGCGKNCTKLCLGENVPLLENSYTESTFEVCGHLEDPGYFLFHFFLKYSET